MSPHTERIERAQEARHHCEVAIAELDEVDDDMRMLASWKYYYSRISCITESVASTAPALMLLAAHFPFRATVRT